MGILQRVPREGSIGSEELASAVDIDESVVRASPFCILQACIAEVPTSDSIVERAMRIIVAQGIALEPSPNHYVHNAKSLAYVTGSSQYFFKMVSVAAAHRTM